MKTLIVLSMLPSFLFADEGGPTQLTTKNTVLKSSYKLKDGRGTVHFVIRNDGEAMGFSYLIEVRPQCGTGPGAPEDFEVADVKSTCDVDLKSVRYNSRKQTLKLEIFDPDARAYNLETQKNPLTARVRCLTKSSAHVIDLEKYCRK